MKARTLIVCLVAALALGFYIGSVSGAFAVTGAEQHISPPPAGDQFDEGPVLVRLPGASTTATRFIF